MADHDGLEAEHRAGGDHAWIRRALGLLTKDAERTAQISRTMYKCPIPEEWGVGLYLKDESGYPTGSVKYPMMRELLRYLIMNGQLSEGRTVIEATSGNAAVAGAALARGLGLPFTTVLPRKTGEAKLERIREQGGRVHFVDRPPQIYEEAQNLAADNGGVYVDHFAVAERAMDWRTSNGLPGVILDVVRGRTRSVPDWIVVGAGTGTTATTIGRHIREHDLPTRLAVVDPENSAYFPGWVTGASDYTTGMPSKIEGIGRPRMEPGFYPGLVDLVLRVPDEASVAAMRVLSLASGFTIGPSSGATLWGALSLINRMREEGRRGIVVGLIADQGEHYRDTYYSDAWTGGKGLFPEQHGRAIDDFLRTGRWNPPASA
ncbi:pyridoxal-phosphate dependent enzyme [Nocardiopsis nanhaiensis]